VLHSDGFAASDVDKRLLTREKSKLGVHWGQRKLAMSGVPFPLYHWDPTTHPSPTFVYVGAAEGTNIKFISTLFPAIKWVLYDPRPFDIKETDRITIHTGEDGWFDNETAEEWRKVQEERGDVYFMSDIRNFPHDATDTYLRTLLIVKDLNMQQEWCRVIKPVAAHLKFPLIHREKRNVKLSHRYFKYMPGIVYFQAWNRPRSYETRLVVTDFESEVYWDLESTRDKIDYVNLHLRPNVPYRVKTGSFQTEGISGTALDDSWDSSAEILIWADYLTKNGVTPSEENIKILAGSLSKVLRRSLETQKVRMTMLGL